MWRQGVWRLLKICLLKHRIVVRKFVLIILFLVSWFSTYAHQTKQSDYSFVNMNMQSHGLSNDGVRSMILDSRGYLWIGTYMGLNRYDGVRIKTYSRRDIGIDADYIGALCEDSDGNIWIGTSRGVVVYDYLKDKFVLPADQDGKCPEGVVNHLHADTEGNVWMDITDSGIYSCRIADRVLVYRYPYQDRWTKMATIDKSHLILCRNQDNIWLFDKDRNILAPIDLGKDTDMFRNDEVHAPVVNPLSSNIIYLASKNRGLCKVDLRRRTVDVLYRWVPGQKPTGIQLSENRYLLVSSTSGLMILDILTDEILSVKHDPNDGFSLAEDHIICSVMGEDGRLWVGTNSRGLSFAYGKRNDMERYYRTDSGLTLEGSVATCIDEDSKGGVWITTERSGLLAFDPVAGSLERYDNKAIPHFLTSVCACGDTLWVGAQNGLYRILLKNDKVRYYDRFENKGEQVNNRVLSVRTDSKGQLFVSLVGGVYKYDDSTESFYKTGDSNCVNIMDFADDGAGNLWMVSYTKGVYSYCLEDGSVRKYVRGTGNNEIGEMVSSPFIDDDGGVWMIGRNANIYKYDGLTDSFFTYYQIALPNMQNCSLLRALQSANGHFWITSTVGLFDFDPQKRSLNMYTTNSGLLNNSFTSARKLSSGIFLLGSADGFISINPERFSGNNMLERLDISEMYIGEKPLTQHPDRDRILDCNINNAEKIILKSDQNSFRFAFSTPDEVYSGTIYAELSGFDTAPVDVSSVMEASYYNVPYGSYVLKVTGHAPLRIIIEPPFILSWAGILLMLLALFAVVGIIVLILDRIEKRRHQMEMEQLERAKEVELIQNKMELLQTVVHEFKTPLTLLRTPLNNLRTLDGLSSAAEQELQIIDNSADYLDRLSKELLEFIRIEEIGQVALTLHPVDMVSKLDYVCFNFSEAVRNRNLKLDLKYPDKKVVVNADDKALDKILNNLIHNALKYSDTYIEVALEEKDGMAAVCVRNDGSPIPENMRKEIFKPFVRLKDDNPHYSQSFGIGLSVAKKYAELQNGSLSLTGAARTEFCLMLPLADMIDELADTSQDCFDEGGDRPTILLVEDNQELSNFLVDRVNKVFDIISVVSAEAALKVISKRRIDIVLTDISMPGMGGIELCRRLSSDFENSHIPIVVISAISAESTKIKCMESGASLYLVKPFTIEYLVSCINGILKKRMALRASMQKEPEQLDNLSKYDIEDRDAEFLRNLDAIVEKHISDEDFNVRQLEEELHMSHTSLNRKMNGLLNMTSVEYIRTRRLNVAARLLRSKDVIPSEVCYLVGFSTPSYFSKCFKDYFGKTPAEYVRDE